MLRVLTITNAAGGVTTATYDAIGNVLSQTDQLAHITRYNYDQRGLNTTVMEVVGTSLQRTTTAAEIS